MFLVQEVAFGIDEVLVFRDKDADLLLYAFLCKLHFEVFDIFEGN